MSINPIYQDGLNTARVRWAEIARQHGWYSEPFYVQVWADESGYVYDSVAYRYMLRDTVVGMTLSPMCGFCADENGEIDNADCHETATLAESPGAIVYCSECESEIESEYAYMVPVESGATYYGEVK